MEPNPRDKKQSVFDGGSMAKFLDDLLKLKDVHSRWEVLVRRKAR
jgi:hypothetical protein